MIPMTRLVLLFLIGLSASCATAPETMTIDSVHWSDDPAIPGRYHDAIHETLGITLLAHVVEWDGKDALKRFTGNVDSEFTLKAPGSPAIPVSHGTGGITSSDGATRFVILSIRGFRDIDRSLAYELVPRNETPGYRWVVLPSARVAPMRSTAGLTAGD